MNESLSFATALNDLTVLEIAGADAADFLHSQLTHDIAGLDSETARLAGYCTAKGRLLGTLIVWQGQTAEVPVIYALVKADIAQALAKRLSMYVLRAKAKLTLTALNALGVCLPAARPPGSGNAGMAGLDTALLPLNPRPWQVIRSATETWIAAPSAGKATDRWWAVRNAPSQAEPHNAAHNAAWQAADIAAGLPWVVAGTQDVFIPQTLNLDLIDGVSFTKGCYPGQEVVARSHYRGTVKRRMAHGVIGTELPDPPESLPGTDIFDAHRPGNPCGRIINAARTDGQTHLLLEIQLSDLNTADFRLHNENGPSIALQALPYAITTAAD